MKTTDYFTESGSRYSVTETDDGQLVLEGQAEQTMYTSGMVEGEHISLHSCFPLTPKVGDMLWLTYDTPNYEGIKIRHKRTSPIVEIRVFDHV